MQVLEGDLEGVVGQQKTLGRYEVTGETRGRQDIYFDGIQISAKDSRFTGSWTTTLLEHNEDVMVPAPPRPDPEPPLLHRSYR